MAQDPQPTPVPVPNPSALVEAARPELRARAATVRELLVDLRLDAEAVAAGILAAGGSAHGRNPTELSATHGRGVAKILFALDRVGRVRFDQLERESAENLRRMFLALANDVRVVLIALSIRLADMRRLDEQPEERRLELAHETMDVFAPLANRLGAWQLKWELEDLAFRALDPETYRRIDTLLAESHTNRTTRVDEVIQRLQALLAEHGIPGRVSGRPKHIHSIYKKMQRKAVDFAQVYDVTAVRVIVEEVAQCYAVLGLVHGLWTPIAGEFDDYIARPKGNDYRSLHTAVVGPDGKSLEIQIRTREMDEFAEYGVAAHWRYKEGAKQSRIDDKIRWLRQLLDWQLEVAEPTEIAEGLRTDVFSDQVYVLTPDGAVLDLPVGSTPLDFAYRIHTEIGHRCRGARINGEIAPLDRELHTGDRVEILTAKTGGPSRDWLSPQLGYVKSSQARTKIRLYFREQAREPSIAQGRESLERELKRVGLEGKALAEIAETAGYPTVDDLHATIGFGNASAAQIVARMLDEEPRPAPIPERAAPARQRATSSTVAGVEDVLSQPAGCCKPVPGDDVVGYVTRGRGLTIHRADCPNLRHLPEQERIMPMSWNSKTGERHSVAIRIHARDRRDLVRDISDVIAREGIDLRSATVSTDHDRGIATLDATLDVRSSDQLVTVLSRLEQLPYVESAVRVRG